MAWLGNAEPSGDLPGKRVAFAIAHGNQGATEAGSGRIADTLPAELQIKRQGRLSRKKDVEKLLTFRQGSDTMGDTLEQNPDQHSMGPPGARVGTRITNAAWRQGTQN